MYFIALHYIFMVIKSRTDFYLILPNIKTTNESEGVKMCLVPISKLNQILGQVMVIHFKSYII